MSALLSKLVMLTTAVLLLPPPGWCCRPPAYRPADRPVTGHSCCERQSQQSTPADNDSPTQPQKNCCCDTDFTAPLEAPPFVAALAHSSPAFIPDGLPIHLPDDFHPDSNSLFSSPPLNVLQCIWRC